MGKMNVVSQVVPGLGARKTRESRGFPTWVNLSGADAARLVRLAQVRNGVGVVNVVRAFELVVPHRRA